MQAVNWLALQPSKADLDALTGHLDQPLPVRKVCQLLARIILEGYPWEGRLDLIPFYHPSQTYRKGEWVAWPILDRQKLRPLVWQIAQVSQANPAVNPAQGKFQALTLSVQGKQFSVAASIPEARFIEPDLSAYTPEDRDWVAEWMGDTFAASLQETLQKMIQRGEIHGKIVNQDYVPEASINLSPQRLAPFFDNLTASQAWVSEEEMIQAIPELAGIKSQEAQALVRATPASVQYFSMGGGRWTTADLYTRLNREVPRGLPVPHIRSKLDIWTEQDRRDLGQSRQKSLPAEARQFLEELGEDIARPRASVQAWQPPSIPIKLPTLNYLHITQAYFPIGHLVHAFAPDVRLVFVQFIEGEHRPYLLDRDAGMLKALEPELLRAKILGDGIPAGTYLWLEYQGGENYRIAPRPLSFEHMVPCKLAYKKDGQLLIEHTEIPMHYDGDSSVFKADMRFSDIEALFAEAEQVNYSIRDVIALAIKDLCAADPHNWAHWQDIFNLVFLRRMCSPKSVSFLLYTNACFEQLGGGYFRFNPSRMEQQPAKQKKKTSRRPQIESGPQPEVPEPSPEKETLVSPIEDQQPVTLDKEVQPGLMSEEPTPTENVEVPVSVRAGTEAAPMESEQSLPNQSQEPREVSLSNMDVARDEPAQSLEPPASEPRPLVAEASVPPVRRLSVLGMIWQHLRLWLWKVFGGHHD
jgi:hypothetical protein